MCVCVWWFEPTFDLLLQARAHHTPDEDGGEQSAAQGDEESAPPGHAVEAQHCGDEGTQGQSVQARGGWRSDVCVCVKVSPYTYVWSCPRLCGAVAQLLLVLSAWQQKQQKPSCLSVSYGITHRPGASP